MAEGERTVLDDVAQLMADAKSDEEAAKKRMAPLPNAAHITQDDLEAAVRVSRACCTRLL